MDTLNFGSYHPNNEYIGGKNSLPKKGRTWM
mgnify:CR=1 FL=1|jgi:hypothetical protein